MGTAQRACDWGEAASAATLDEALLARAVLAGSGGALVLQGGVGAGKSWALERIAAEATRLELAVLRVRLTKPEERSFETIVTGTLAGGAAVAEEQDGDADLAELADRIAERLEGTPSLVIVDDLHCAGPSGLRLVAALSAATRRTALGLVAAARPWPEAAARRCAELARRGDLVVRSIEPLSDGASAALLRLAAPADAAALITMCAGNPLLLTSIAAVLETRAPEGPDPNEIARALASSPTRLSDMLAVDGRMRACLSAASVLGDQFRPELAIDVAEVDGEAGEEALDALCRLGLLRQGPGRALEFAQPLLQRALYAELTPPSRVRLHARAFEALARRGFERRAAEHATEANLSGSDAAIDLLERVGHTALRDGAWANAAKSFRSALELAGDRPTPDLHIALAAALVRDGKPDAAVSTLERTLSATTDERTRLAAMRLMAQALTESGRRASAVRHLRRAAASAARVDPASAAEPLVDAALLSLRLGHLDAARELCDAALEALPDEPGEDTVLCDALARVLSGELAAIHDVEVRGLDLLSRALTTPVDAERLTSLAMGCALALAAVGRVVSAERLLSAALRTVRNVHRGGPVTALLACSADLHARLGHLDEALTKSTAAVEAAGPSSGDRPLALAVHARVLLHLGRTEDCDAACAECEELLENIDDGLAVLWLRSVRAARLLLADSRAENAGLLYAELETAVRARGGALPGIVGWEVIALSSLARAQDFTTIFSILERLDEFASPVHQWAVCAAALGHGLADERRGAQRSAEEHLRHAASLADTLPGVLDRISVNAGLGSFLWRAGRDLEARRRLESARELASDVGAVSLARAIESELGVMTRRGRRGTAPGELTPQERRVAGLAATGRSNREIATQLWISVNTVETHLQRAFAKLNVKTRTELAGRLPADRDENVPA